MNRVEEHTIPDQRSDQITPEDARQPKNSIKNECDKKLEDPAIESAPLFFDLTVSEDKNEAYILVGGKLPDTTTIEEVKNLVKEKGICYGLVDDSQINDYLNQGVIRGKPWLIAKGKPPKPGQDARIIYHFDKDPLKIGTIKTKGNIDFKEKGEIPQVEEGTLLAEKIPLVKEEPGMDVYGQVVPVPKALDTTILAAENTKLSGDGLKIFSKKAGRPVLSEDGRLFVYPEIEIKGDVGLETGHIHFNGFINVYGSIQEGFKVRGGRLSAKEIYKADVEVDGDIIVEGGIIGSKIVSKGNIKVKYIHSSIIEALGNVIVEEEVMHSKFEIKGAFITHSVTGKVFSSEITAEKGIEANQIGSDSSKPCTLLVGVDSTSKKFIDRVTKENSIKKDELQKIKGQIDLLQQELNILAKDIGQLAQIQDRGTIEKRSLKKMIEELRNKKDLARLTQVESESRDLEAKVKATEKPLNSLMDKQDQITEKISGLNQEAQELEKAVKDLDNEVQGMTEGLRDKKGVLEVKVYQMIYSGTLIQGPHSSIVLEENHQNILLKESLITNLDAEGNPTSEWKITISKLQ
jgi:uncharacterized protein (DUF342 family)